MTLTSLTLQTGPLTAQLGVEGGVAELGVEVTLKVTAAVLEEEVIRLVSLVIECFKARERDRWLVTSSEQNDVRVSAQVTRWTARARVRYTARSVRVAVRYTAVKRRVHALRSARNASLFFPARAAVLARKCVARVRCQSRVCVTVPSTATTSANAKRNSVKLATNLFRATVDARAHNFARTVKNRQRKEAVALKIRVRTSFIVQ